MAYHRLALLAAQSVDPPVHPPQKRRGRPPGSKNKPKDNKPSRGRGRGGRGRGKGSVDTVDSQKFEDKEKVREVGWRVCGEG